MKHSELNKPVIVVFLTITIAQFILFALKVTNIMNCSWAWVFAPLWIPYAMLILAGICLAIYLIIERIFNKHG